MQTTVGRVGQKVQVGNLKINILAVRIGLSVISVALALFTIFTLAEWAETALWHHATQHVLLFSAGFGLGATWFIGWGKKEQPS